MRKILFVIILLLTVFLFMRGDLNILKKTSEITSKTNQIVNQTVEINETVKKGDTLFDIFKKYKIDPGEILKIKESTASIHNLRELHPGCSYRIVFDNSRINSFTYWIDDNFMLNITHDGLDFKAEKIPVEYIKEIHHISGVVKDNLISSMGEDKESLLLALRVSDIFQWDIDFTSDLREGDTFKIIVEGLYLDGGFKKFGEILSVEFINNKQKHIAYRFECEGKVDYYDVEGKSLRKAFLKAPLNFRRISSYFSKNRLHPIIKIYRPHHGIDYVARVGTPVSATGNGTVTFAGRKGQFGKLVIVKHLNNYKTYYGHLSQIKRGIRKGVRVEQGDVIGYVGATGLATGPHLHYEMRLGRKHINPLTIKLSRGKSVPKHLMVEFRKVTETMDHMLAYTHPANSIISGTNNDKSSFLKGG